MTWRSGHVKEQRGLLLQPWLPQTGNGGSQDVFGLLQSQRAHYVDSIGVSLLHSEGTSQVT